jgi:hypothetical protein
VKKTAILHLSLRNLARPLNKQAKQTHNGSGRNTQVFKPEPSLMVPYQLNKNESARKCRFSRSIDLDLHTKREARLGSMSPYTP